MRETPRSWEGFSVKEKMVDFLLSSVSTEQAQRVDTEGTALEIGSLPG